MADALGGGQVRKSYLEMKSKLEIKPTTSSELQKLMKHAADTTEFYKAFRGYSDIRDFPIIKKSMIKENYDRFISSAFRDKPLHIMKTSGSSGERFAALQNKEKRKRVLAEVIYFNELCGFHLGERYIYSRVWFRDNQKSNLVQMAQNMLPLDCSSLTDKSLHELAILLQNDSSIKLLMGYATSLGVVADYFVRQSFTPDRFNLKLIVSGSERLDAPDKARLKKAFGCPVVSRYSNQENGILAQQGTQGDTFFLNTAHYYFEFLQLDCDEPAPIGQQARLILTDLYNRAMPFIRYDTGDIVIGGEQEADGVRKTVLKDVSGRSEEIIYDTRGNKISPHSVALDFRQFDRLSQYQFVQDSQIHYTVKLVGACGVYDDRNVRQSLHSLVGEDAVIEIVHLDEIPRAASGKTKKVICKWNGF